MRMYNRCRWVLSSLSCAALVLGLVVACGDTGQPSLGSDKTLSNRSKSETIPSKTLMAARTESDESGGTAEHRAIKVFSKALEPLTLQRGGSVKMSIPLSENVLDAGLVRGVEFQSSNGNLQGTVVRGRTLNLTVSEEAAEGQYDGNIIVRLENGRLAAQKLAISVIP